MFGVQNVITKNSALYSRSEQSIGETNHLELRRSCDVIMFILHLKNKLT